MFIKSQWALRTKVFCEASSNIMWSSDSIWHSQVQVPVHQASRYRSTISLNLCETFNAICRECFTYKTRGRKQDQREVSFQYQREIKID